jgi:hypothetical protein
MAAVIKMDEPVKVHLQSPHPGCGEGVDLLIYLKNGS